MIKVGTFRFVIPSEVRSLLCMAERNVAFRLNCAMAFLKKVYYSNLPTYVGSRVDYEP